MKSLGEIEAAVCVAISQFQLEYLGRGPKHVNAYLAGDFLVIRLEGVLTAAERHLVQTAAPAVGRDLLKQVRTQLIEIARPELEKLIQEITAIRVVSLHHDISTITGEEVIAFTLAESPKFRVVKK
jgi:uncharacterized protein YbcI